MKNKTQSDHEIDTLRLYKFDGNYLEFTVGEKTDMGTILEIGQLISGWYQVDYSSGRYATFNGFSGVSILYAQKI